MLTTTNDKRPALTKLRKHIFVVAMLTFLSIVGWFAANFSREFAHYATVRSPDMFWVQWGLVALVVVAVAFIAAMAWIVAPLILRYVDARQDSSGGR